MVAKVYPFWSRRDCRGSRIGKTISWSKSYGSSLSLELSQALESAAGGLVLELLPELQELDAQHPNYIKEWIALPAFVKTRISVGRPVHILAMPTPRAHREMPKLPPPDMGTYGIPVPANIQDSTAWYLGEPLKRTWLCHDTSSNLHDFNIRPWQWPDSNWLDFMLIGEGRDGRSGTDSNLTVKRDKERHQRRSIARITARMKISDACGRIHSAGRT